MEQLYKEYKHNGTVNWDEFEADPETNQKKVVKVRNSDFIYGTLRVLYPCAIKFMSNVNFNPDNGDGSNPYYEPPKSTKAYKYTEPFSYVLGFFAGITLEADGIIVDLNRYIFRQHNRHLILQKVFALIELNDQPFIPGQGPADFGPELIVANNCWITNGTLGTNSHHGIHGNNNCDIKIDHLKIERFEVTSIGINGGKNIDIDNISVDGTADVAVLAIFSAAVFLRKFTLMILDRCSDSAGATGATGPCGATGESGATGPSGVTGATGCCIGPDACEDLREKLGALQEAIDLVVDDVAGSNCLGYINPDRDITKVFINRTRIPDGTTYGMLFNKPGAAVGPYSSAPPEYFDSKNIKIRNVCIKNIIGSVKEVIALSTGGALTDGGVPYGASGVQKDTTGAVFQICEVLDPATERYVGNVVSDMQLALARWSDRRLEDFDPCLAAIRDAGRLGTLNIHPAVVAWGRDDVTYEIDSRIISNTTLFSHLMRWTDIRYIGNGDSMFHVNKGFFGIRLDGVKCVDIQCTKICKVVNKSNKGSSKAGPYTGPTDGGHLDQNTMRGYTAADAYGIMVSGCADVTLKRLSICCIKSFNGSAYGVYIGGGSRHIKHGCNKITNVETCSPRHQVMPNKPPEAVKFYVDDTIEDYQIEEFQEDCKCEQCGGKCDGGCKDDDDDDH